MVLRIVAPTLVLAGEGEGDFAEELDFLSGQGREVEDGGFAVPYVARDRAVDGVGEDVAGRMREDLEDDFEGESGAVGARVQEAVEDCDIGGVCTPAGGNRG